MEDICGICQDEVRNIDRCVLRCNHVFCFGCLLEMYRAAEKKTHFNRALCPNCRGGDGSVRVSVEESTASPGSLFSQYNAHFPSSQSSGDIVLEADMYMLASFSKDLVAVANAGRKGVVLSAGLVDFCTNAKEILTCAQAEEIFGYDAEDLSSSDSESETASDSSYELTLQVSAPSDTQHPERRANGERRQEMVLRNMEKFGRSLKTVHSIGNVVLAVKHAELLNVCTQNSSKYRPPVVVAALNANPKVNLEINVLSI